MVYVLFSASYSPPKRNAGVEQLRAQMRFPLRQAGVPEECIQQLSTPTLVQIKSITGGRWGFGPQWITIRQEIRFRASKDCPWL